MTLISIFFSPSTLCRYYVLLTNTSRHLATGSGLVKVEDPSNSTTGVYLSNIFQQVTF